jgi:hypothetical protein
MFLKLFIRRLSYPRGRKYLFVMLFTFIANTAIFHHAAFTPNRYEGT